MLPSDAIQVLENTSSRVVVWDPPSYSFASYLFVLAAALLVPAGFLLFRRMAITVAWVLIATALSLLAFASLLITSQRLITLSRSEGTLIVKKSKWGLTEFQSIPIGQIRRIAVENIGYNRSLVLIAVSGQTFSLGNGSNREGYDGAADALNQVLGPGAK